MNMLNEKKVWKKVEKINWMNDYFDGFYGVGYGLMGKKISSVNINYKKPINKIVKKGETDIQLPDGREKIAFPICDIDLDINFYSYDKNSVEITYNLEITGTGFSNFNESIISINVSELKYLENTVKQDIQDIVKWLDAYDGVLTDENLKESDEERIAEFVDKLRSKLEKEDE